MTILAVLQKAPAKSFTGSQTNQRRHLKSSFRGRTLRGLEAALATTPKRDNRIRAERLGFRVDEQTKGLVERAA